MMLRALLGILLLTSLVSAQPELRRRRPDTLTEQNGGETKRNGGKLRALHEQFEGRRQDVVMRLSQRRLELAQLLRRDDADKATIKGKIGEILDLEKQRQELFVDEFFEAKSQLNQRQFAVFRQRVLRSLLGGKNKTTEER